MRVCLLTTSYPRDGDEHAGRFVADQVLHLRERGIEVDVLAPGRYRDFGLAYGDGVMANLRRRPLAGPLLLADMAREARRAAKQADLVHAHWLPAGAAAAVTGRPFVVTVHGSDVEVARRVPQLARTVLRRARVVVTASRALADEVRRLGARRIEVIPNGVDLASGLGVEAEPPHVLYAGRLSPEKGVEELAEAARGLPLVVCGDGPLRSLFPDALGFVPRAELERRYAAAAVVACPSRREGFGVVCAEAMAHGKPVVASGVGGLLDLVVDGETGLLVTPGDAAGLRAALERLLEEPELRRRLGSAARGHVAELCSWERVTEATIDVYREAAGGARRRG